MADNSLNKIQEVIDSLSKSQGKRNIFVKASTCNEAKIVLTCQKFSMLDFLAFANSMRSLQSEDLSNPSSFFFNGVKEDDDDKIKDDKMLINISEYKARVVQCLDQVSKSCEILLTYSKVTPYDFIKTERTKKDKNFDNLILLFWRIHELSPVAPLLTMFSLVYGIPSKVFTYDDIFATDIAESKETEISLEFLHSMLNALFIRWSKCRIKSYRNKRHHRSSKALERNFWLMIFFMKMQQEIVHYLTSIPACECIDYNAFYEAFLTIWPYSPQLFFAIDKPEVPKDKWCSMLDHFFQHAEQYQWSINADDVSKLKKYYDNLYSQLHNFSKLIKSPTISFDHKGSLLQRPSREHGTTIHWLTPGTPYFAAYFFFDDFEVCERLYHNDQYKSRFLSILQKERSNYLLPNWGSLSEFTVPDPPPIDELTTHVLSEKVITKKICSDYWMILLGVYTEVTSEHYLEPTPIQIQQENASQQERNESKTCKGLITIPMLRTAQYLGLQVIGQKTQDAEKN